MDPGTADEDLIRRIAARDAPSLGALYDRHASVALAVAMKIVGDRAEAEDVLHNVFVKMWQDAGQFDSSRGSALTWLLSSVRNASIDRLRRRAAFRRAAESLPAPVPSSADPAVLSEERARLTGALDRLPADQREAMELAYFEGLTQTEIAQRLGQPLGTVKTRIRTAMMKLREALGGKA